MKIPIITKHKLTIVLLLQLWLSMNVLAVKFYSINSIFGISTRATNSICKDDNGFIWASSKTGILRMTDSDCRTYHLPYDTTGALLVNLIYENSKLIAYTNNGQIFSYNSVYDRFDLVISLSKLIDYEDFSLYSLLMDESGNYWLALGSGLYKYDSVKLSLIDDSFKENYYLMTWYDKQHIVIAKPEGIWMLNIQTRKSKCLFENKNISKLIVSTFFLDKKQNMLWMGTYSKGLFCYNFASKKLSHVLQSKLPKQPILAIEENSDSTILIGIDGQGVWELTKNENQILNVYKESADNPHSLRGNGVYDIFYDQGKRVWVCTISGGVSFYELTSPLVNQITHQVNNTNSLVDNDINSIIEDRDGKIWFATNNGISCWGVGTDKWGNFNFNKLKQAQVFLTLCEDNQGRIWAGSYSSGIYVLDGTSGKELAHYTGDDKKVSGVSNFIFDIFKDSQGDLWIGGIKGKFICYQAKVDNFKVYTNESISCFAELSPNQILLGCSSGIKLLNKQTGDIEIFLSGYVVQDLLVSGNIVWAATSGEGLVMYNFNKGTIKKYTIYDGLPSNFINSISDDNNGLWLGTENGLCRFNTTDKTINTFSSIYSLSGVSYNKSSLFRLKNGQMAWGTNNGAVFFSPQSLKEISSKGKIYFQDLAISGLSIRELASFQLKQPVDSLQALKLKYSQNTFTLELISILMQSGSKFSWKLEGFDKTWSTPSENRIITYTNIPSGEYQLKIKLYDHSLLKEIHQRSISITIIPPFWRKAWFIILVIIGFSGFIFLYFLYHINKLNQKHTANKIRFFTNTAHDIRTSLTLIKAPVEELSKEKNLSEKGSYYLNLAIEQTRQLATVVTQLMDFQKFDIGKEHLSLSMVDIIELTLNQKIINDSFAKTKNIEIVFTSNYQSYTTAIDESKIEKVINNLISNAIKYSHNDSQVNIDLKCDDKKWILQVKDNGIGINKKSQQQLFKEFYRGDNAINSKIVGSGIGLLFVKKYVLMHGGDISFNSQENVGSTFQVVIPFKNFSNELQGKNNNHKIQKELKFNPVVSEPDNTESDNQTSKQIKILIVEDNDNLLNFMKCALNNDFEVYTATDGEEAWKFVSKHIPDLVVSDILMPNVDGFELCKLIKSTYETSHIPVIMISALSEITHQLEGLGLGADDYLTKPFNISLLVQRIKTIIRNNKVIRDKALRLIKGDITEPVFRNELNDKFVKKMLEVTQSNISNIDFDKDKFAAAMNVSSSLLYKKAKSLTDQSPSSFIKNVRLNHALDLLQSQKYTVTEVSELCGFISLSYFSKVFRNHFGKSPSEILN